MKPATQTRLFCHLAILMMDFCIAAAPAPRPADFALKQTTRDEIIARQLSPVQKRASGVPFQTCYDSPDYDAAVYSEKTSGAIGLIGSSTSTTLQGCVEACRGTSGEFTCASVSCPVWKLIMIGCRGALFGDEGVGEFYCNLYEYVTVGQFDNVNSRIIFLDTTCADNAVNGKSLPPSVQSSSRT